MTNARGQSGIGAVWIIILVFLAIVLAVAAIMCYNNYNDTLNEQKRLKERLGELETEVTDLGKRSEALAAAGMVGPLSVGVPFGIPRRENKLNEADAIKFLKDKRTELMPNYISADLAKKLETSTLYNTVEDLLSLAVARVIFEREQNLFWVKQKEIAQERVAVVSKYKPGFSKRKEDLKREVEAKRAEVNREQQEENAKYEARKTDLTSQLDNIGQQLEAEPRRWERESMKLKNAVKEAQRQFEELLRAKDPVSFEVTEWHGHIVSPDPTNKIALIDFGTSSRVVQGMRFLVAKRGKNGRFEYKGEIEVKEAGLKESKVEISKVFDKNMPMVDGDYIVNPFFNKYRPIVVVLAGNKKPVNTNFSFDEVARRLTEWGSEVSDKVDSRADFLVWTEDVPGTSEHPESYYKAVELGVPIGNASELYKFLGE